MTPPPGTQLGPYKVLGPIGAGGMGEVYRAKDTRLDRIVAIKVLPTHLADSPELRERFEREARTIASLNHPHICTLHDIGHQDGTDFLVMEYLEGETLAQRLVKGWLPLDQVLQYAIEIADALDKAHRKGITHRDLKPGNIMLTKSGTKLLDFGLAKLKQEVVPANVQLSQLPTANEPLTAQGTIVGTLQYMAPEQLEGKEVDARTDIFAFGAVVYEMTTGRRAFEGKSQASLIAKILETDPPPISSLQPMTPPALDRVVKKCLAKEPEKRWQSASDLTDALTWIAEGESPAAPATAPAKSSRTPSSLWMVTGALALVAATLGLNLWRTTRLSDRAPMRLDVNLGPNALAGTNLTAAISPDGTRIVFLVRGSDGRQQLATRLLEEAKAAPLAGTENASDPFFSPDGQWVGFFADGKLKKISVGGGGVPVTLCDAPNPRGGTWSEDGNIIAELYTNGGLSIIPASGGVPKPLTRLGPGIITHRWPQILPGAKEVLFTASPSIVMTENASIGVASVTTGETKIVLHGGYFARYLSTAGSNGYLVYVSQGALFSVPFDLTRLEVRGVPTPLVQNLAANPNTGGGQFDFSQTGVLVYRSGKTSAQSWPVVWLDRSGKTQPLLTRLGFYGAPSFSPDGQRLATAVDVQDVFVYDLQRDVMSRLTFTSRIHYYPTWSPDGKYIVFGSPTDSGFQLGWIPADGGGEVQGLLESKDLMIPYSFSPDGRRLAYAEQGTETGFDLWTLPLDLSDPHRPRPGKPEPFLRTAANKFWPAFSPDGRWIAYQSDESGRYEIYVRPFPGPGGKWQISTSGGQFPIWSKNGRELLYETLDNRIAAADYAISGDSFIPAKPRLWSDKQLFADGVRNFDVAPDGNRLAVYPLPEATKEDKDPAQVTFVLNFFDEVRRASSEKNSELNGAPTEFVRNLTPNGIYQIARVVSSGWLKQPDYEVLCSGTESECEDFLQLLTRISDLGL